MLKEVHSLRRETSDTPEADTSDSHARAVVEARVLARHDGHALTDERVQLVTVVRLADSRDAVAADRIHWTRRPAVTSVTQPHHGTLLCPVEVFE